MQSTRHNQSGFVSIIVCMIIMTILSLITIGFAQIMAREQRQALDRQLSSQAFYAAESGVNDALINLSTYSSTECSPPKNITSDGSVRNTCITANPIVPTIEVQQLSPDQNNPKVFPIITTPNPPRKLEISWRPTTSTYGGINFRGATDTNLPAQSDWLTNTGAIKMYLIVVRQGNNSRADLINAMGYTVLMPTGVTGLADVTYANITGANYGSVTRGNCDSTAIVCKVTLDISAIPTTSELYLVVTSLYQSNSISIDALDSANGSLQFRNVQAVIDSTGRATDVVRRIQVRQSLVDQYTLPAGALEATDPAGGICKLLEASPAFSSPGSGCSF